MQYPPVKHEDVIKALDYRGLVEAAQKQAGLSEFGDESFLQPLRKLLSCVADDADFHAEGLEAFRQEVVRCLVNRLRMDADVARHPEILDEDVSDPIIVIGLPRSGTTKLQRMLSAAPEVQKLLYWRLVNPAPFPGAKPGQAEPRIAAASLGFSSDNNPALAAAHLTTATQADEDWALHVHTFDDWIWSTLHAPSPSYVAWVMQKPAIENYRYVRKLLQYLQWQDGGKRGRPWILKSVGHIANMDALLAVYPNATLVHAHRDPRQAIPSFAKAETFVWSFKIKPMDPHEVGRLQLRWWKTAMDRYLEARTRLRLDARILDVAYGRIRDDPMPAMREVYQRAGLELTAEAEKAMQQWDADNEQHQHGSFEYSLAEFGLSEETIDEAFAEYIRRFIRR